jgi:hypothetical protein
MVLVHCISIEVMELDDKLTGHLSIEYDREFVVKCLSNANLDGKALAAQKAEVTKYKTKLFSQYSSSPRRSPSISH